MLLERELAASTFINVVSRPRVDDVLRLDAPRRRQPADA